jgi:hypothetical protein
MSIDVIDQITKLSPYPFVYCEKENLLELQIPNNPFAENHHVIALLTALCLVNDLTLKLTINRSESLKIVTSVKKNLRDYWLEAKRIAKPVEVSNETFNKKTEVAVDDTIPLMKDNISSMDDTISFLNDLSIDLKL